MAQCYCCSPQKYSECCQPLLEGKREAATPEELMRSRYSAFAVKNLDYVVDTTDPQAHADMDRASTKEWMDQAEFTKLEILRSTHEGNKGTVEFKAHFKMNGVDEVHHEISKFRKHGGTWFFRDGRVMPPPAAQE